MSGKKSKPPTSGSSEKPKRSFPADVGMLASLDDKTIDNLFRAYLDSIDRQDQANFKYYLHKFFDFVKNEIDKQTACTISFREETPQKKKTPGKGVLKFGEQTPLGIVKDIIHTVLEVSRLIESGNFSFDVSVVTYTPEKLSKESISQLLEFDDRLQVATQSVSVFHNRIAAQRGLIWMTIRHKLAEKHGIDPERKRLNAAASAEFKAYILQKSSRQYQTVLQWMHFYVLTVKYPRIIFCGHAYYVVVRYMKLLQDNINELGAHEREMISGDIPLISSKMALDPVSHASSEDLKIDVEKERKSIQADLIADFEEEEQSDDVNDTVFDDYDIEDYDEEEGGGAAEQSNLSFDQQSTADSIIVVDTTPTTTAVAEPVTINLDNESDVKKWFKKMNLSKKKK